MPDAAGINHRMQRNLKELAIFKPFPGLKYHSWSQTMSQEAKAWNPSSVSSKELTEAEIEE